MPPDSADDARPRAVGHRGPDGVQAAADVLGDLLRGARLDRGGEHARVAVEAQAHAGEVGDGHAVRPPMLSFFASHAVGGGAAVSVRAQSAPRPAVQEPRR